MRYKHPWCPKSDAATILLLPAFERGFFYGDGIAQLAMQTLAVGGQYSFGIGMLSPGCLVPLALDPSEAGFAVFLDTSLLIVVLWIVGASLPLHFALEAAFFSGIGGKLGAESDQIRLSLL